MFDIPPTFYGHSLAFWEGKYRCMYLDRTFLGILVLDCNKGTIHILQDQFNRRGRQKMASFAYFFRVICEFLKMGSR